MCESLNNGHTALDWHIVDMPRPKRSLRESFKIEHRFGLGALPLPAASLLIRLNGVDSKCIDMAFK